MTNPSKRKIPTVQTIAGVVVLGIVGNAMWEIIARPGLGRVSTWTISVVSIGWRRIRDLPYESAAVDPLPVSAIILPSVLSGVVVGVGLSVAMYPLLVRSAKRSVEKETEEMEKALREQDNYTDEAKENYRAARRNRWWVRRGVVLFAVGIAAHVGISILVTAMDIRRFHEANVRILAPYVQDQQIKLWQSRFALVKTKLDYEVLHAEMDSTSRPPGVTLHTLP